MAYKYLDTTGLTALWAKIKNAIPKKTSELVNDRGYLTADDIEPIIVNLTPIADNVNAADDWYKCQLVKNPVTNTVRVYYTVSVTSRTNPIGLAQYTPLYTIPDDFQPSEPVMIRTCKLYIPSGTTVVHEFIPSIIVPNNYYPSSDSRYEHNGKLVCPGGLDIIGFGEYSLA